MDADLANYYRRRAAEYDDVYVKPERQADIARLATALRSLCAGRRVLEVAAGTGYWTVHVSQSATAILASDVADQTLALARRRSYGPASVDFAICDAFELGKLPGSFDAGLACFWLSHLARDRMRAFLDHLEARLEPNALVVIVDNRLVEGSNHPITRTDCTGNTYQRRALANGEEYEILKNFPSVTELIALAGRAHAEVVELEYYWLLSYRTTP